MFWETLAASFLLFSSFVFWFFAAFVWGFLKAAITFFMLVYAVVTSDQMDLENVWLVPVAAVVSGLQAAWSIPTGIWDWAKFGHPWWAVLIGCVCLIGLGGSKGR